MFTVKKYLNVQNIEFYFNVYVFMDKYIFMNWLVL